MADSPCEGQAKSSMWERYHRQIIFAVAGAGIGYVAAHPYTMFIYTLMHPHQSDMLLSQWRWRALFDTAISTFQPAMLPMALSFIITGGLVGLLAGVAAERKRKMDAMARESEKKRVAMETLHELMVTLSHYLLNANTIIGGMVRHCRRVDLNQEILHSLTIIEEQARKVDAVIGALQKVTDLETTRYTAQGETLMLDVAKEIEEELRMAEEGPKRPV